MKKNRIIILIFFILLLFVTDGTASPFWPVKDIVRSEQPPVIKHNIKMYLALLFNYYHYGVSPNDFSACPFNPTCSYFAKLSVKKFGVVGILMATDRLMRDNYWSSLGDYPTINGKFIDKPSWHYLPYYWRLNNENITLVLPDN